MNTTALVPASSHEEAGHGESEKTPKPAAAPGAVASSKHKRKHDRSHSGDHDSSSGSKEDPSVHIQTPQRTKRPTTSLETQTTLELPPIPSNEDSSGNGLNVQDMKTSGSLRPANALSAAAASVVLLAVLGVAR
ncbi:hypothetical protein Gpo141_00010115 [Globisporangium polare]